jgi:hypothetical protein
MKAPLGVLLALTGAFMTLALSLVVFLLLQSPKPSPDAPPGTPTPIAMYESIDTAGAVALAVFFLVGVALFWFGVWMAMGSRKLGRPPVGRGDG